jgi:hypothetical protein
MSCELEIAMPSLVIRVILGEFAGSLVDVAGSPSARAV